MAKKQGYLLLDVIQQKTFWKVTKSYVYTARIKQVSLLG